MSAARAALATSATRHGLLATPGARPGLSVAAVLLGDVAALSLAAGSSVLSWSHFGAPFSLQFYANLWPVLFLFPGAYAAAGLYPGFGRNPADELRRLWASISVVYAALAVTVFLLKDGPAYSRGVFVLAWTQTLILAPWFRSLVRSVCSSRPWWGYPVAIAGASAAAARMASALQREPRLGLKPAMILHDTTTTPPGARDLRARCVILPLAELSRERAIEWFNHCSGQFRDIIVIPDLAGFSTLWVEARDMNGVLGLHSRQRLLLPASRVVKRAVDLFAVIAGSVILLPLAAIIAALIKMTSAGPIFYRQTRLGRGGAQFEAWKFRSMVANANQVLDKYLHHDARLRDEWQQTQKLRNDPRITPIGRFLRRTSLDELPQLWNILVGDMSLVGPRPIVQSEIQRYGDGFALYRKVTPGLTGLWQVSGRNRVSYEERVNFDTYYIRNWSPWLDLYILARTVAAVLLARGAY